MKPNLSQTQLFLDDRWIAESCRIQRIWHEAQKYPEPVLKAEYPWEYHAPVAFGTILKRQDKFQIVVCRMDKTAAHATCCLLRRK